MTLEELCKEINRSPNTLKRSFNRTVEVFKKKGILIERLSTDNYKITYDKTLISPKEVCLSNRLVGKRFGHLTVLHDTGKREYRSVIWLCQCDCGRTKEVTSNHLNSGRVKTCGTGCPYYAFYEDLTNKKFGLLTALYPTIMKDGTHMYWMCKCDCGNAELKEVASNHLKNGNVQSCGCIKTSVGEINIENILKQNNIIYQKEIKFDDLKNKKPLRYDFGIYNKDKIIRLIEFDGIQHYQEQEYFSHSLTENKINDKIKNDYAKEKNIPLIRIPYWERDYITLDMIMEDKYLVREEKK